MEQSIHQALFHGKSKAAASKNTSKTAPLDAETILLLRSTAIPTTEAPALMNKKNTNTGSTLNFLNSELMLRGYPPRASADASRSKCDDKSLINKEDLVYPVVRRLLIDRYDAPQDLLDLFEERRVKGLLEYGRPLCVNNGRSALRDLVEELVDAINYAQQALMEKKSLNDDVIKLLLTVLTDMTK